jgi:hypothetical protein
VCSLTASVDLTAFERCDRRHKLLFEYPIIFWTPRGSLNHSGTGARPVASSRQPLARPLCLHAPGPWQQHVPGYAEFVAAQRAGYAP